MNVYIGGTKDYSAMRGPAPEGFHVPTKDEWNNIYTAYTGLGLSGGTNFSTYLKLPLAGMRLHNNLNYSNRGVSGSYWTVDSAASNTAKYVLFDTSNVFIDNNTYRSYGMSIRSFKNTPIIPDNNWTTLYAGTGDAGIFHDTTNGLISISSNGTTWYTIADKNLGATAVYNSGDTLSESNCGKVYQRGNNYGFSGDANYDTSQITQSSTKVDVTGYGPGNYYSSSTWITVNPRQSSANDGYNLRGGVTGVISPAELKNAYIGGKYMGEYIKYNMNADSNGNLYVPIGGINTTGSSNAPYNWKVSIDGGSETTYSGTGSSGGKITISGYTTNSSHTIKITPITEDYLWARAYGWYDTGVANLLTEIIYDGSYMGYGESATSTGDNFRAMQYTGCTSITEPTDENIPNTVTTIGDRFRNDQYDSCTALLYSAEEDLPSSVTSIGTYFRYFQYYGCTAIKEIKGWKDLSIGNSSNYRAYQYTNCNTNKTVKVLSNVGYNANSNNGLNNTYVTSVYVPSAYLSNFTGTSYRPRTNITDSKFVGY